jgi:alpha-amylase
MGYKTMLTEGAKHVLGWKSPNYIYCNARNPKLKVLLKNYTLSDDIAFRFSSQGWPEWPLTAEKFVGWLNDIEEKEEVVNLFMDYETFGEHQWKETGIFDFMAALPEQVFKKSNFKFATPSELGEKLQPVSAIQVPFPISWADEERDLTAWVGNEMQDEAVDKLYELEDKVKKCNDPEITSDWYKLQNSDHFYYMCTKWFSDGDVHKYFNPYNSPYEAFINYMNVLSDFVIRVDEKYNAWLSDTQKIFETTGELGREIKKAATKTVKQTSKKVKAIIDEQKEKSYSFDEIKDLSNARIKKLVKEVDVEHIAVALKDAGDELKNKVLPNLTKTAKNEYDKLVGELKKVKKTDIKKSRERISAEISKLFSK